jgi:DUF4097 and DUF4098 domain-containing protein YvlB
VKVEKRKVQTMEKTFDTDGPVEADVLVPAGVIEVERADAERVTVSLEPVNESRRADDIVAAAEVSYSSGKLRVHVAERTFRNVEVRCRLHLPEGSALMTKTASADVRVAATLRSFDGVTASGDVELVDVTGDVIGKSASGDFACATVGGRFRVRTASGDVTARQVTGDVELALASGDVDIADAGSSVDVKSASGDVRLGCVHRGRVRAQTASGDVTIAVAQGVGAYLDVTTVSGDTRCTLPFQENAKGSGAMLELLARTVSGDIVIEGAGR